MTATRGEYFIVILADCAFDTMYFWFTNAIALHLFAVFTRRSKEGTTAS